MTIDKFQKAQYESHVEILEECYDKCLQVFEHTDVPLAKKDIIEAIYTIHTVKTSLQQILRNAVIL